MAAAIASLVVLGRVVGGGGGGARRIRCCKIRGSCGCVFCGAGGNGIPPCLPIEEVADEEPDVPDAELVEACDVIEPPGGKDACATIGCANFNGCAEYDSSSASDVSELVSDGVGEGDGGESASCSCRNTRNP